MPQFHLTPILVMCLSMLIVMAETTGNVLLIDRIVGQTTTSTRLADTIRADGLSTIFGGCLNSFPYNAFSQNAGLLMLTNVKSRFVVATAGVILVVLGLFPKFGAIVAAIPAPVLGGAAILMFGMTIAAGIQELTQLSFKDNHNGLIVALSIAVVVLPLAMPHLFSRLPGAFKIMMESGIFIGVCTAVLLNIILNRGQESTGATQVED